MANNTYHQPMLPPITWFGGKSKFASKIIAEFPPHQTYCEPFGGSAAVLLAKQPSKVEVYNDIDDDLVNLFQVLRQPALFERLRAGAENTLYSRSEFILSHDLSCDPVERARRFLVRQRQSYGGRGAQWSYSIDDACAGVASAVRRWSAGIERLPLLHKRLKSVQIEKADWHDIMSRYDAKRTLFYVDPPYMPDTRVNGKYRHELNQADHVELVETLLGIKGMVILSGYHHSAYAPLTEAGWISKDYDVPAYTSDSRSRRTECLWISPNVVLAKRLASGQPDLFNSPVNRMREGAYHTHISRTLASEARILTAIRQIRLKGNKVTITAIAAISGISREHISRKYRHLIVV